MLKISRYNPESSGSLDGTEGFVLLRSKNESIEKLSLTPSNLRFPETAYRQSFRGGAKQESNQIIELSIFSPSRSHCDERSEEAILYPKKALVKLIG
jgi:hypothetical protein